jgi:hypothetical protein
MSALLVFLQIAAIVIAAVLYATRMSGWAVQF